MHGRTQGRPFRFHFTPRLGHSLHADQQDPAPPTKGTAPIWGFLLVCLLKERPLGFTKSGWINNHQPSESPPPSLLANQFPLELSPVWNYPCLSRGERGAVVLWTRWSRDAACALQMTCNVQTVAVVVTLTDTQTPWAKHSHKVTPHHCVFIVRYLRKSLCEEGLSTVLEDSTREWVTLSSAF